MKKLLFILIALLLIPIGIFAQSDVITSPEALYVSFASLVVGTLLVTAYLKKLFGKTPATPNLAIQILSWLTGVALTFIGWGFNLGFLAGLPWYYVLLTGIGAALAANGVADTKIIESILALFKKKA